MTDQRIVERLVDAKVERAFAEYGTARLRRQNDRMWRVAFVVNWTFAIATTVLVVIAALKA